MEANKSLSDISQKCPTCGMFYHWTTWEEPLENLQMLRLSCRQCGTLKTYAIPRDDFRKNLFERFKP